MIDVDEGGLAGGIVDKYLVDIANFVAVVVISGCGEKVFYVY